MFNTQSTDITCPAIKRLLMMTLIAGALGLAGCSSSGGSKGPSFSGAQPGGPGNGVGPGNGPGNGGTPGDGSTETQKGTLETSLGNTGTATDNLVNLDLSHDLGVLGKQLDPAIEPITTPLIDLTQRIGGATGLGIPVSHVTYRIGSTVTNLGEAIDTTGLPLNLDAGLAGLLSGVGQGVISAGGLLNGQTADTQPLTSILGHTTEGVVALTDSLGQGVLGDVLGTVEPNGGLLRPITDVVSHVLGAEIGQNGILKPVTDLTGNILGNGSDQAGLLSPVTSTVGDILGGTGASGDLLSPVTGIADSILGGAQSGGLLNPVTDVVSGVSGGGSIQGGNLLAPVTGIIGGVAGSLPGGGTSSDTSGLLSPVTGLLGGILGSHRR